MNRVIFLVIFLIVGIGTTYYLVLSEEEEPATLPVINPIDLEDEMVDPELLRIGYGHKIGDFSFDNQNGEKITQQEVDDKVYVAEYFFTTCKSICPIMNRHMQRVQKANEGSKDFKILSFTVDPKTDTVAQMKRYAEGHGALGDQWHFLTGKKEELYALARKSFFVLKPAEAQNLGDAGSDFIHTNNFVLVDRERRIRG
ncbi:MAG: SCO family protein, partial [Crocinitomicaceae bacterium]|nr:SCO family protein [Crocinitomicaceae bacterium]